jgi:VanZ family protein
MIILFRLAAYALAAAVSYATLGPPHLRPHSHLSQNGEHAFAFGLLGLAFALGYPRQRLPAAVLTTVFCGGLELLQRFAPGRHARLTDFLVDALATLAGFAIVSIVDLAITSMRRSTRPQTEVAGPGRSCVRHSEKL